MIEPAKTFTRADLSDRQRTLIDAAIERSVRLEDRDVHVARGLAAIGLGRVVLVDGRQRFGLTAAGRAIALRQAR